MLSWHAQTASTAALVGPYLYNMMAPFVWGSGALTTLVGCVLLISPNSKTRVPLLNIWVVLILMHTAMVVVYGANMVKQMNNLYLIHKKIWAALGEKGVEFLKPGDNAKDMLTEGGTIFNLFEQMSAGLVFKMSPYPFNFIFFMGLRPDIASVIWMVGPGVFSLLSIPFIVAIRNYFASDKEGIRQHRKPYKDAPLSRFICQGVPGSEKEVDDDYLDAEEDLASTFDGVYSSDEDDYVESESDVEDEEEEGAQLIASRNSNEFNRPHRR